MKLYELTEDYNELRELLDGETDIEADEFKDTLEAIKMGIEEKADGISCLIKEMLLESEAIKNEEKKLSERRKRKETAAERLKEYLSSELQKADIKKIETARNNISFRKSETVEIDSEIGFVAWASQERDDLLTYQTPKINKTALKNAIKDGLEIDGVKIFTRQNIIIK